MAIFSHKCPHCLTDDIALRIVAAVPVSDWEGTIHLSCPRCRLPSGAYIRDERHAVGFHSAINNEGDVVDLQMEVTNFWPSATGPRVPDSLPPAVERAFLQGERNFASKDNEEAAGTMYRRALDIGLKVVAPAVTGTLYARIDKLVADHTLTPALGEWAHEIRSLGNESAHDEEIPTREELGALRNFTDLVLRYLFTLPAMVLARRAKTK